jgi:hypothetical protein
MASASLARAAPASQAGGDLQSPDGSPLLHSFPLPLLLWIAAVARRNPQGGFWTGAAADWGKFPQGGGVEQGYRLGHDFIGRRPRINLQ